MIKLIIVGGSPRSGTTLIQNILDSHPDIYGGPEFGQLPAIIKLRRSMHEHINAGLISDYLSIEEADQGLRKLILDWFSLTAARKGVKTISEKTPENALYLNELLELIPPAIGIHVVRDPRAILASMIKVEKRYVAKGLIVPERLASIPAMCTTIAKHFVQGLRAVELHNDCALTINYEKLVMEPQTEICQICDFIKVPFDAAMLHPMNHKWSSPRKLDHVK
jgi:hypothetical protein